MINVVNYKKFRQADKVCFKIMRPSPLGNPFIIGRDGNRVEVIHKYREWLWQKIQSKDPVICSELKKIRAAAQIGDVYLICCCKPLKCHGDVVKSCIEWRIKNPVITGKGVSND